MKTGAAPPYMFWRGDASGWDYINEACPPPFPVANPSIPDPTTDPVRPSWRTAEPIDGHSMAVLREMLQEAERLRRIEDRAPVLYEEIGQAQKAAFEAYPGSMTPAEDKANRARTQASVKNLAWRTAEYPRTDDVSQGDTSSL